MQLSEYSLDRLRDDGEFILYRGFETNRATLCAGVDASFNSP